MFRASTPASIPASAVAVVLALVFAVVPLRAQATGEALIRELGGTPGTTNPTFPAPRDLVYKRAWHVTDKPETPGALVQGFRAPATFLRHMDVDGVPRANLRLAIIVHGEATASLLTNAAYRTRTGSDNGSLALLNALHEAGVEVVVCGQALINRNVPRDHLLPFVKVAVTATTAHAILHAQGYDIVVP